MRRSANPSPFTSPAEETKKPDLSPTAWPENLEAIIAIQRRHVDQVHHWKGEQSDHGTVDVGIYLEQCAAHAVLSIGLRADRDVTQFRPALVCGSDHVPPVADHPQSVGRG